MGRDKEATAETLDQLKKDITALNLANGKALLSKVNIAKAALAGDQAKLLTTCEREVKNMPGEEVPIMIVYSVKEKATKAQLARWQKVLQTAKDRFTKKEAAAYVDYMIEYLKK